MGFHRCDAGPVDIEELFMTKDEARDCDHGRMKGKCDVCDLQAELEATNRQVEILSDALAESRREVAAKDEALDLALEVLIQLQTPLRVNTSLDAYDVGRAITAIKQARSAPVQEPVAWAWRAFDPDDGHFGKWGTWHISDYKPPRQQSRWFQVVPLPNTNPPAQPAQPAPAREPVGLRDALVEALTSVYVCGRVWEAWNHGTMSEGDFQPAAECDEVLDALVEAVAKATPPASQPELQERVVIDRIVAEHGYPKEFREFEAALKARKATPPAAPAQEPWSDERAFHEGRSDYEISMHRLHPKGTWPNFHDLTTIQQAGWVLKAAQRFYTTPPAAPVQELTEYDAGLMNDYGGGNVEWWQDYIRYELGCAYEHYKEQLTTPPAATAQKQSESAYQRGYMDGMAKQRQWVGLTHDEYDAICDKHSAMSDFDFLEDIEAKLKEKNT
jgi:hypothetical protein